MKSNDDRRAGSALLATLFASVAIVLVGVAFLMTTQTESRIARHEVHAERARYAAEAVARAVMVWFERPGTAPGFPFDLALVERDREIVDETDPYGANPIPGGPQYKEGVDLDADGGDDLFHAPYRGAPVHTLLGTEHAPDMRIAAPELLDGLSHTLFGEPANTGSGLRTRIRGIDVFAPPYERIDGAWIRRGIGSVKVRVAVERSFAEVPRETLAERTLRVVLDRVRYAPSFLAVVHACGPAELVGPSGIRWGAIAVTGNVSTPAGFAVPHSIPRAIPGPDGADRLWTGDPMWVDAYAHSLDPTAPIPDPWARLIARGAIAEAPSPDPQPYAGAPPPPPGSPPPWTCCDRSNVFQHQAWLECPEYDYSYWKGLARSGLRGVHYYAWQPPDGFRASADGPVQSFRQVFDDAAGEPGLWFFDTEDGRPPRDEDGDGEVDNLTPEIVVGAGWHARGFIYLNAEHIRITSLSDAMMEVLRAPGEPGVGAPGSEPDAWLDLAYPAGSEATFFPGASGDWDAEGPELVTGVAFRGLLVTNGAFEAGTGGSFVGSVVARSVRLDGSIGPATRFYREPLSWADWPPEPWAIPRFVIARVTPD